MEGMSEREPAPIIQVMMRPTVFTLTMLLIATVSATAQKLPVRITWAQGGGSKIAVHADRGATVEALTQIPNGIQFVLEAPVREEARLQKVHIIWADLIAAADADTARRLGEDASMTPQAPRLYVRVGEDGARGFAVTVDQLRRERAMWTPSFGLYIAAGEPFVAFAEHMETLKPHRGQRMLERLAREPEASYEQYTARWEDMGSPLYTNPQQTGNGHVVCLSWDGSIHKFGVDRGAGVRNDLGNPDHFQLWFDFGDLAKGVASTWKSQRLLDGLPLITTVFERDQVRYEVEQFAYPLNGPAGGREGEGRMVLMSRVRLSSTDGKARRAAVTLSHRRAQRSGLVSDVSVRQTGATLVAKNAGFGDVLLEVDGATGPAAWFGVADYDRSGMKRVNITVPVDLPANGARDLIVKLPSPVLDAAGAATLAGLDYERARAGAIRFWSDWVARGAQFETPEKAVNDLFRASLWHALRLPRRHRDGSIDLPYSNFAYSQTGSPWPVNQAVYVDYALFGLRGYSAVAAEEIREQYRTNQELNGHVSGYANWLVYTPAMMYAVAQDYLLADDRAAFEKVLPESLKAMDWCIGELNGAADGEGPARGLMGGPLNDLTGDGVWAFNQAYMYAGLDTFGQALERIGHPRAAEARQAASRLKAAIDRGFHLASANSPLVQLRDHTWSPYVPGEIHHARRLLDDWYPADVDTGPVHLLRLKAAPAHGDLADALLNDHEDNLFYRGWGIANEPVYNQHATAYLLRDEPEAVIRTFYSYMASAFSHTTFEPVEHRFTHGQYFGPPSTDGAWFELYRNMLVMERDDDTLLVGGFTPRRWLEAGRKIAVRRAPTRFGELTMTLTCGENARRIEASIELQNRTTPGALVVRLRHPTGARIRKVEVNGAEWTAFDPAKEWIRIDRPTAQRYRIVASY